MSQPTSNQVVAAAAASAEKSDKKSPVWGVILAFFSVLLVSAILGALSIGTAQTALGEKNKLSRGDLALMFVGNWIFFIGLGFLMYSFNKSTIHMLRNYGKILQQFGGKATAVCAR